MTADDYERFHWRVGKKVRRTIYAVVNENMPDFDPLIGVMDTPHLAEAAVRAHNEERKMMEKLDELEGLAEGGVSDR